MCVLRISEGHCTKLSRPPSRLIYKFVGQERELCKNEHVPQFRIDYLKYMRGGL